MTDGDRGFDRDEEDELFRQFQRTPTRALRNEIVERYIGFAHHVANRFATGGQDPDVRQVAMYGLIKAADRYDPHRGTAFTTFAGATIEGEIKRHYRDQTWKVRVPRRAKELHLLVRSAGDELAARNGRSPSLAEIAEYLGISREDVNRGLAATAAYSTSSIDGAPVGDDDLAASGRNAALAQEDTAFEEGVNRRLVVDLLQSLPDRERRIVELRFFHEMSQSEIAAEMDMSQMHVSRLLRRSFRQMRVRAGGSPDDAAVADPT